ncbi:MAG: hypothetical protein NHF94_01220 [Candidatus Bostrichicola ureolyticus]|nr:MAG: hypothetical protein NHF94_01220 [Candidatus Bostrichicola ureolyticus]
MNKIILSIILSISLLNIGVLHSNDSYKSRKIFNIPEYKKNNFNDDKLDNKKSTFNNDKLNEKESNENLSNNDLKNIKDNLDYLNFNKPRYFFLKKMFFYLKFKINNFLLIFKKDKKDKKDKKVTVENKKFYFKLNKDFDMVPIDEKKIDKENVNLNDDEYLKKDLDKIKDFDFSNYYKYSEYFNREKPIIEHYNELEAENITKYTADPNNEYYCMDYELEIDSYYNDFEKVENLFYENNINDNEIIINDDFYNDIKEKFRKNIKKYDYMINEEYDNDESNCCCMENFIKIIKLINETDDYYKKQEKNMIKQYKENNIIVIK